MQNKPITELVLATEGYVEVAPETRKTFEFSLAFLIKDEIRTHKWNRGSEGISLTWEQAREEWLSLYYKDFLNYVKNLNNKKKKKVSISNKIINNSFERRRPMIGGHLI